MKRCSRCKVEKPFEEFSKHKNKKDGYKNQCKSCDKQYREENKDKLCEYAKQYYEENKYKISEHKKQYREENKDKISEQKKQYYEENKDKLCEKNKKYYEENKEVYIAYSAKRRAAKLQATPNWLTEKHYEEIKDLYTICKMFQIYTGLTYHVDHIMPLQGETVCGLHVPWNLQILEASTNLSKSNRLLEEYLYD